MRKTADEKTDEEIARAVQEGDTEAFGVLVARYEPKLRRYAKRFLLVDEADDLLQDVFLAAFQNIRAFDSARRFSPWIYRIAHNTFVNSIRKRSLWNVARIDFDAVLPVLTDDTGAEDEALHDEEKRLLDTLLPRLDEKYREVLDLYYMEELSYEEISDVLGIPKATVGVRLKRARESLRREIRRFDETFIR